MIHLFIILLILLLIFLVQTKTEVFTNTCNFNPFGKTLSECKDKCNDTIDCNSKVCNKICEDCNDKKRCNWYDNSCTFETTNEVEPMESYDLCLKRCSKRTNCDVDSCITKCKNCRDSNICKWVRSDICSFKPSGSGLFSCIDSCVKTEDVDADCNYDKCKILCNSCSDPTSCGWKTPVKLINRCKFSPWGPDKQACVDRCTSDDFRNRYGDNSCNLNACDDICNTCDNPKLCKWVDDVEKDSISEIKLDYSDKPPPQHIRGISGNSKIIIEWINKHHSFYYETKDNNYKTLGFIIHYFKSDLPMEGTITKNIEFQGTIPKNCRYLLDGLENGTKYTITISGVNSSGIGPASNVLNLETQENFEITL